MPCRLENVLADVNADHAPGAPNGHLHGIDSFATAKVDDHLPGNPREEFIPHQDRESRAACASAHATVVRNIMSDPLQDPALYVGESGSLLGPRVGLQGLDASTCCGPFDRIAPFLSLPLPEKAFAGGGSAEKEVLSPVSGKSLGIAQTRDNPETLFVSGAE